ncbi:WD40 repeat domain-containing protein [Salinispira pacifica]|uniref:Uncharacterized protein n=1 Tax=Salinispira pacifica TaxID=1307761 RepID=V5WK10_9SPIO|nr:hypothetical protein [Salinispira pacifica]AHC15995.1 hypothetical protein L21SP2_2643 [Salinispira pacifica]
MPVLFIVSLSALNAQPSDFIQTVQRETLPQEQMLSSGVYSPFGNYFGVISRNNRVRMYDSSHRLLWTYRGRGHHGTAPALSISRSEKFTFFPGYGSESAIAMVSTSDGELIRLFNGHSSEVRSLILTPDNSYLISFAPGELFLWRQNGTGYTLAHKLNTGELRISSMAVSPDGNTLVLGNSSDYINLYRIDAENHRLVPRGELRPNSYFSNTGYLNGLAFSPDGQWLAAGVREEITIYRREETGYEPFQIISELDDGYVYSLAFAPDGESFFAGFGGGTVGIWKPGTFFNSEDAGDNGRENQPEAMGEKEPEEGWKYQSGFSTGQEYIAGLAFHPMGQSLATVSISQNGVVLWALEGSSPGEPGTLAQLLRLHSGAPRPGDAQLEVITRASAGELLARLGGKPGDDALAPRGMFETAEAYRLRRLQGAERAFDLVMELIRERFQAREEGGESGGMLFPLQGRGVYDADGTLYTLPVAGAEAGVHMAPGEAEQLYMNWQDAAVRARPSRENGYEWLLLHPVQNREYPIIFERDPILGISSKGDTRTIPRLSIDERMFMENIQASPVFPVLYRSYARQPVVTMEISNKWDRPVQNLSVQAGIEGYAPPAE